jgi:hypothetical protein
MSFIFDFYKLQEESSPFLVSRIPDVNNLTNPNCLLPDDKTLTLSLPALPTLPEKVCDQRVDIPLIPLPAICVPRITSSIAISSCPSSIGTLSGDMEFTHVTGTDCDITLVGSLEICVDPLAGGHCTPVITIVNTPQTAEPIYGPSSVEIGNFTLTPGVSVNNSDLCHPVITIAPDLNISELNTCNTDITTHDTPQTAEPIYGPGSVEIGNFTLTPNNSIVDTDPCNPELHSSPTLVVSELTVCPAVYACVDTTTNTDVHNNIFNIEGTDIGNVTFNPHLSIPAEPCAGDPSVDGDCSSKLLMEPTIDVYVECCPHSYNSIIGSAVILAGSIKDSTDTELGTASINSTITAEQTETASCKGVILRIEDTNVIEIKFTALKLLSVDVCKDGVISTIQVLGIE